MKLQGFGSFPSWAGALALCAIALGPSGGAGTTAKKGEVPSIQLGPEARDLVRIIKGETFVVPAGRVLVITGIVRGMGSIGSAVVKVDDQAVFGGNLDNGPIQLAIGVPARAGETVTVEDLFGPDPSTTYVVLGYLGDE